MHVSAYKSHKIQVIVNPLNMTWNPQFSFWAINTAAGPISYDFSAPRDLGSYYVLTGLIFPKGTVNKMQADYSLDNNGMPLQPSDSLGSWMAADFVVTAYDLVSNFPASGTRLTEGDWSFFFNDSEDKDNLYSVGRQKAGVLGKSSGQPIQFGRFAIDGGTGKYEHHDKRPKTVSAKMYLSVFGSVLIKIRFDKEIEAEKA